MSLIYHAPRRGRVGAPKEMNMLIVIMNTRTILSIVATMTAMATAATAAVAATAVAAVRRAPVIWRRSLMPIVNDTMNVTKWARLAIMTGAIKLYQMMMDAYLIMQSI